MGLAGSCSAGLLEFAWSGADTKRLHLGRASQLGLESALLARQGLRGPATVLEGRYGYFNGCVPPFAHSALKRAVLLMMPTMRRQRQMDQHGGNMHVSGTKSAG
jgi:2-methylcitrate dehydratase PrpD